MLRRGAIALPPGLPMMPGPREVGATPIHPPFRPAPPSDQQIRLTCEADRRAACPATPAVRDPPHRAPHLLMAAFQALGRRAAILAYQATALLVARPYHVAGRDRVAIRDCAVEQAQQDQREQGQLDRAGERSVGQVVAGQDAVADQATKATQAPSFRAGSVSGADRPRNMPSSRSSRSFGLELSRIVFAIRLNLRGGMSMSLWTFCTITPPLAVRPHS